MGNPASIDSDYYPVQSPVQMPIQSVPVKHNVSVQSKKQKLMNVINDYVPEWFLYSAIIVGAITIFFIMLKVNPLLAPLKSGVLWMLDIWETFLKKDEKDIGDGK